MTNSEIVFHLYFLSFLGGLMEEMDFLDKVRIGVTTNLCFKGNYFVCVTDVNPVSAVTTLVSQAQLCGRCVQKVRLLSSRSCKEDSFWHLWQFTGVVDHLKQISRFDLFNTGHWQRRRRTLVLDNLEQCTHTYYVGRLLLQCFKIRRNLASVCISI